MAIRYPDACKGTTAGAMRQAKKDGYSISGGIFNTDYVRAMVRAAPIDSYLGNGSV
jgi:hypothetical protein